MLYDYIPTRFFFVLQFPAVSNSNIPIMRMPEVGVAIMGILKFFVVVGFEKYVTSFT